VRAAPSGSPTRPGVPRLALDSFTVSPNHHAARSHSTRSGLQAPRQGALVSAEVERKRASAFICVHGGPACPTARALLPTTHPLLCPRPRSWPPAVGGCT
jgi:hypothetical protein